MEVISYSDDAFLNFGIQQLLNTPQKETRVCRIGHVALDFIVILNDLDITLSVQRLARDAHLFSCKNIMVLTEVVSPLIIGYLLRSASGLVVYNIKNNHSEMLIDIYSPGVNSEAEKSLYFSLSDNELFILLALSMGIKPELLTRITGRSEKRISAIKRNVMNKLEIRNGKVFYSVIKALFIHDANNSSDSRAAILTVKHEQLSSRLL